MKPREAAVKPFRLQNSTILLTKQQHFLNPSAKSAFLQTDTSKNRLFVCKIADFGDKLQNNNAIVIRNSHFGDKLLKNHAIVSRIARFGDEGQTNGKNTAK